MPGIVEHGLFIGVASVSHDDSGVFSLRLRYRSCREYPPLPFTGILPSVVGSGDSGVQGVAERLLLPGRHRARAG